MKRASPVIHHQQRSSGQNMMYGDMNDHLFSGGAGPSSSSGGGSNERNLTPLSRHREGL